jgi:uronate dehydrogenase
MMGSVLITGAAGRFGSTLRQGLRDRVERLCLTDRQTLHPQDEREVISKGDLTDFASALRIVRDVDAVVHAAGIPDEAGFEDLVQANIRCTYNVLEAARLNGIPRIVLASSAHVVGFYAREETIDAHAAYRPDTLYGATKVFGEALARMYVDKHGLQVACLRIGSFRDRPENKRQLSTWLSPGDAVELVDACLRTDHLGFAIIYGASANERRFWRDDDGARVGFHPKDNAEKFASGVADDHGPDEDRRSRELQGGVFTSSGYQGGHG